MSVSKEAVEAAARASFGMWAKHTGRDCVFEDMPPGELRFAQDHSRAALTAALPHLIAAKDAEIAPLRRRYGALHQLLVEAWNVHPAFVDVEIERKVAALEMSGWVNA